MKKKIARLGTIAFSCTIIFAVIFVSIIPEKAYAETVRLNQTSVTIYMDNSSTNHVKLKVVNSKAKATWSSSLKNVVDIQSTGKSSATVKGLKPGKVTVTAKVGKQKYTCSVTVMRSNAEYSRVLNKTSQAISTAKYKTLMNLAPKTELVEWIDSLGETARRKILGGEYGKNYWKNAEDFYMCTMGRLYATTEEQAEQGYIYTTGVDIPELAKAGNYRIISEKKYEKVYGQSAFENLKRIYAEQFSMDIEDAKTIKCSFDCKWGMGTSSCTFTMIKANNHWYFSPYDSTTMSKWLKAKRNLTSEDSLYLTANKRSVKINQGQTLIITIEPGSYDGEYDVIYDDTSITDGIACEWGEWIDDNKIELYIYPTKKNAGGIVVLSNSINDTILMIYCY